MVSSIRRQRQYRERHIESLFSVANLDRKIKASFAPLDVDAGTAILSRLDGMPAVAKTQEQLDGLRLGAKLRALYLSGGDLAALSCAIDVAMTDHRDLHMLSEDPAAFRCICPSASREAEAPCGDHSGFDRFVAWLEQ